MNTPKTQWFEGADFSSIEAFEKSYIAFIAKHSSGQNPKIASKPIKGFKLTLR